MSTAASSTVSHARRDARSRAGDSAGVDGIGRIGPGGNSGYRWRLCQAARATRTHRREPTGRFGPTLLDASAELSVNRFIAPSHADDRTAGRPLPEHRPRPGHGQTPPSEGDRPRMRRAERQHDEEKRSLARCIRERVAQVQGVWHGHRAMGRNRVRAWQTVATGWETPNLGS